MSSTNVNPNQEPQPPAAQPDKPQPSSPTPAVPDPAKAPQPTAQPASPATSGQVNQAKDAAGAARPEANQQKPTQPPAAPPKVPTGNQPAQGQAPGKSDQPKADVKQPTVDKASLQIPPGKPTTTGTAVPPSVGETRDAEGHVDEAKVKVQESHGVASRANLGGPTPLAAKDAPVFTAPGAPQIVSKDVDWKNPQAVNDLLEKFVFIEDASGIYPYRGVCHKCGWQSYQISEPLARQMVKTHAQKHLREV